MDKTYNNLNNLLASGCSTNDSQSIKDKINPTNYVYQKRMLVKRWVEGGTILIFQGDYKHVA